MEQTKAVVALEPYLALSKSVTAPRAIADLVTQATSHPNTYVFAELLAAPQFQALAESPEYAAHLTLLKIFSYGTYATYQQHNDLPPLNDAQALKLRQLSLLTLARDPSNLAYARLQQALDLPDSRSVEDLVISAVYADLLAAQLDPRRGLVHVSSLSPLRDLPPGHVPEMLSSLREWSARCSSALTDLDSQISSVRTNANRRAADQRAWDAKMNSLIEEEKQGASGARQGAGDASGVHGRNQANILSRAIHRVQQGAPARYGKRGSVEANVGEDDEYDDGNAHSQAHASSQGPDNDASNAMDVDDDGDYDHDTTAEGSSTGTNQGKKRASRRRL